MAELRTGIVGVAAVGSVLLLAASATALPTVGKPVPVWRGKTTTGQALNAGQFKGKVVLLNFFNNYCSPCFEEYPHLQAMHKKYGSQGFSVVSVSNDAEVAEAAAFSKKLKTTFPVIHDPKSVIYKMMGDPPVPANVVIDRTGKVIYVGEGTRPKLDEIEKAVAKAVAAK